MAIPLHIEEKFILLATKIHLDKQTHEQLDGLILEIMNWDYLSNIAIDSGMAPLVHDKIGSLSNNHLIPDKIKTDLQQAYYKTLSRNIVLYDYFKIVIQLFQSENISVIALKGIYMAEWLYKDIGLRQLSDIDLLASKEDDEQCIGILHEYGFKESSKPAKSKYILKHRNHHHPPMMIKGISVEVHTELFNETFNYQLKNEDLWKHAVVTAINNTSVLTLDFNHSLIYLCLHLDKHFSSGGFISFNGFCDITNILTKHKDVMNWKVIESLCQQYNCSKNFFRQIMLSCKYFHAPVPGKILEQYKDIIGEDDDIRFIQHLRRQTQQNQPVPVFRILKETKGLTAKVLLLWHNMFPSTQFMVYRYKISNKHLVWFYYPYRIVQGIKQFINYMVKRSLYKKA